MQEHPFESLAAMASSLRAATEEVAAIKPQPQANDLLDRIRGAIEGSPLAAAARAAAAKILQEPVGEGKKAPQLAELIIREKPAGVEFLMWMGVTSLAVQEAVLSAAEPARVDNPDPGGAKVLQEQLTRQFMLTTPNNTLC